MDGIIFLSVFFLGFAVLAMAATAWGVDTRPGSSDPRAPIVPTGLR